MKTLNYLLLLNILVFYGCSKYLDEKPLQRLTVPNKLEDLQALLDDHNVINIVDVTAGEVSADDYYLDDNTWASLPSDESRRMYTWENDYLFNPTSNDWFLSYRVVYSANIVLDNLSEINRTSNNAADYDNVKGQALYLRGKHFLQNAGVWCLAYDPQNAEGAMGIPIRLNSDFNEPSERPSLKATYSQIIDDLRKSSSLLPNIPLAKTRASRPAAFALLARTYLMMGQYDSCYYYADLSLQINAELLNYNTDIKVDLAQPFEQFNKEVLIDSYLINPVLYQNNARVDTVLFASYEDNDIRKKAFFKINSDGSVAFKGNYSLTLFGGIAIDEVYLMKAETLARMDRTSDALIVLNKLLENRYAIGTFTAYTEIAKEDALELILKERRKELIFRGLRWTDVKRLNREGGNIVLTRKLNNKIYTLPSNDLRYALPLPELVIERSGMEQNPR